MNIKCSFHLFTSRSSLIYFNNALRFSVYKSWAYLVKFLLKYIILFDAIVHEFSFYIFYYLHVEIKLIFTCWSCILKHCNSFKSSNRFLMVVWISIYRVMSFENWENSCFLVWMPFISFPCLISLTTTSSTVLNKSGKIMHPCLFLILGGKLSVFHSSIWD